MTKTFITLSLADMATKVKLPSAKEAEAYMLNMIRDGEIFATINQKDGKLLYCIIIFSYFIFFILYLKKKEWFRFMTIQKSTIIPS